MVISWRRWMKPRKWRYDFSETEPSSYAVCRLSHNSAPVPSASENDLAVSGVIAFLSLRISDTVCTGWPAISANSVTDHPRSSSSSRRYSPGKTPRRACGSRPWCFSLTNSW